MGWSSQLAPHILKSAYRQSRLVFRSAVRSFGSRVTTCKVGGVVIRVGVSSEIEHFRADTYSTKEPETLDWLDRELTEEDIFFDVGANIGLYSLYAAKSKPGCTIFSFEPESQNYARLCKNIALNAVANVVPCSFPLSDREAFDYFRVSSIEPGSALHSLEVAGDFRRRPVGLALRQGVLSTTLDALVERYGLPAPTILKIDVDGIEEKILDGARAILGSAKLRTALIELNFYDPVGFAESARKITAFGFKLVRKSDWVWEQNGLKSQNCIFYRA
jgi:FkbM family methyltransferase